MAFVLEVKVVPSSGKQAWKLDKSGKLKCYLKSPPEKGLANAELLKMLAKGLGLTLADLELIAGATSRAKLIKIAAPLTFEQVLARLGIDRQTSLI